MSQTSKGRTNAKWTSSDKFRNNYDQIFGKKAEEFWCDYCAGGNDRGEHAQDCRRPENEKKEST